MLGLKPGGNSTRPCRVVTWMTEATISLVDVNSLLSLFGARDQHIKKIREALSVEITHLHAHFLHTPAPVARYASMMRSIPWSVSAHARDIWTSPAWEKREKLAEARFAVTCTRHNVEHLRALAPSPAGRDSTDTFHPTCGRDRPDSCHRPVGAPHRC